MDIKDIAITTKPCPALDHLIDYHAILHPEKIAIKHGDRMLTYKEVAEMSGNLALLFKNKGIRTGDVVGVAIERSPEMVLAILGILKAGAVYLPIDTKLPVNRINYMLSDSEAKFLVKTKAVTIEPSQHLEYIYIDDVVEEQEEEDAGYQEPEHDDKLAYILYTSGSTGNPKGVEVKYSGLLNLLLSIQQEPGITNNDVMLATTTISFDIAALEMFLPLISGAKLVIADAQTARDGRLLIQMARDEGISIMQGTPIMWLNMLESGWEQPLFIKIFCGGEAMSKELAKKLVPKCNSLWNMYGPTETTVYSTIKHVTAADKIITIGKPILNTQVYILDEQQNIVADGEVGEICIGGTGVAAGYINKPELTAERFMEDKFSEDGGQLYKTGDLGRWLENGEIECLGRIDHQIKIRGYRIETEEVEYQLKQIEGIKEALVVLFTDYLEHKHLVAYIVTKTGDTGNPAEWKKALKETLPDYMVPDIFKAIPAIPRMPNGKIDRKQLPDPMVRDYAETTYEAPSTPTEEMLTAICLKNIALDRIGVNDDFFELGIDSLAAVYMMVKIEEQFGRRLPLSSLIQNSTIKKLGAFLDAKEAELKYKVLVPIRKQGSKPPLYIVHGIGLNILNLHSMASNLSPDQPVYGIQSLGLEGGTEALSDMEGIAKYYVDEIVAHNPQGPHAIAGYSFGGFIAFEMARQLKAMGKEVAMLGMFDTNIQNFERGSVVKHFNVKMMRQFHKLIFRIQAIYKHPVLTTEYLNTTYSKIFFSFLKRIGLLKDYNPESLPPYMLEIVKKLELAYSNYEIKPLDIEIELFKADIRVYYVDDREYLGWGKYALGGVNVHHVPGDHRLMFKLPNDKILAKVVQSRLDKISSD